MHLTSDSARRRLYSQAFLPVTPQTGTPYPCAQAQIDRLEDRQGINVPAPYRSRQWVGDGRGLGHNRDVRDGYVTPMDAARELERHNRSPLSDRESNAVDGLQQIHNANWGPDLAMKAFGDLDILLFSGRLKDQVRLEWTRGNGEDFGTTEMIICEGGKAFVDIALHAGTIFLNADHEPWRKMWGTLLHEMCVSQWFPCKFLHCYDRKGESEVFY